MTLQTKYEIGQKVYYPTDEFIDDRGTIKHVVKELTITRIQASAWSCVRGVGTGVSYEFLEEDGPIDEFLLFPTEEAAWEDHERMKRVYSSIEDEVMKWGD